MQRRPNQIISPKNKRIERVRCGDHLFMDLLSRPEADVFLYVIGPNGCGYVGYFVRWDFGDEDLTTPGAFQCVQNHSHSIFQSDCKACHIGMGDWQDPLFSFFYKEGNDRSV